MIAQQDGRIGIRVRGVVAGHFIEQHAISPEDAISYDPPRAQQVEFARLCSRGLIREVPGGRYWFDVAGLMAQQEAARRRAVPIAIFVALGISLLAIFFYR